MSHWRTLKKVDEFGVNFDGKMKEWKSHLEQSNQMENIVDAIFATCESKDQQLQTSQATTTLPITDQLQTSQATTTLPITDQLQTSQATTRCSSIDASAIVEKVRARINGEFSNDAYLHVVKRINDEGFQKEKVFEKLKLSSGYQIIGDNVDLVVKVKHMSSANQNNSIHWFHLNGVLNRVHGHHLSNSAPMKSILDVENVDLFQENVDFLNDLIPLVTRVVVTKIPAFKNFKDVIVWHIPHRYSEQMSKTSTQVPLGLLFKNENINEEMIDILQDLHNNYLPITKSIEDGDEVVTVIQKLFFGGDELTDERARRSKDARCDGDTEYERLEGFLRKVEDWHAVRILYQVLYDIFYKPGSGNDVGTMCSNLNVVNNVNARTTNVLDNLNYCKDYVNLETDAYITAAAMKYFNMDSLKTSAESFIPPNILDASKQRRRIWLHKHMEKMLYKFVMADQQLQYEDIRSTIAAANQLRRVSWFYCVVCGKPYKYLKAKENHVKKEHPDYEGETTFIPEESKEQVDSKSTSKEKDDVFDYARLRLSMGLFLRNFDDAIKEGDGERIIRCWKFALLIYRAYNHTKYALAALNLQAYTQAMLTPRLAHSLIWNRSVNNHGGPGRNIPLDLRLEHLNHLLKGLLKHLGPNLTESAAGRCSKAISSVERLLESVDDDLEVKRPKGHHKVRKSEADFQTLVNELAIKGDVFKNSPSNERCYTVMANFRSSLISGLDYTLLNKWITHHKKEFFKLEPII